MKRSRDSGEHHEGSNRKKKVKNDKSILFAGHNTTTSSTNFAASIPSLRNNKRNINEMNEQLEPESERPAKRMNDSYNDPPAARYDDVIRDEVEKGHFSKKKRNDDALKEQLGSEREWAARRMHISSSKKRAIGEIEGEPKLESGRPSKRMARYNTRAIAGDHDIMRDEAVVHSSPNISFDPDTKPEASGGIPIHLDTDTEPEESGGAPLHLDTDTEPEESGGVPLHLDIDTEPEESGGVPIYPYTEPDDFTTSPLKPDRARAERGKPKILAYTERIKSYHRLLHIDNHEIIHEEFSRAYERGIESLAIAIHDSPQKARLWALDVLVKLGKETRGNIIRLLSEIELTRDVNDPANALPNIMTDMVAHSHHWETPACVICGGGFCSSNREGPVDVEDVVWKDCKRHLMHLNCFRRKVAAGEVPLKGACECISHFSTP